MLINCGISCFFLDTTPFKTSPSSDSGLKYYQVALSVREESVLQRELRSLEKTGDHYPKYLLTLDMDLESDYNGITKINVIDWLLKDN